MNEPTEKELKRVKSLERKLKKSISLVKDSTTDEFIKIYSTIRDCREEIRSIMGEGYPIS